METESILDKLLHLRWQDERELAGESTVETLVRAVASGTDTEFRRAKGLANWDTPSIKTMLEVLMILKTALDIWIALEKVRGRRPAAQEFVEASAGHSEAMKQHSLQGNRDVFDLLDQVII